MATEKSPARIAVCQNPRGEGVWWDVADTATYPGCISGCNCTPVVYARVPSPSAAVSGTGGSPNPEQRWTIWRCPGCLSYEGPRTGGLSCAACGECQMIRVDVVPEQLLVESRAREEKLRTMLERLIDVALVDGYGETVRDEAEALLADGPSPSVPVEGSEQASKPGLDEPEAVMGDGGPCMSCGGNDGYGPAPHHTADCYFASWDDATHPSNTGSPDSNEPRGEALSTKEDGPAEGQG